MVQEKRPLPLPQPRRPCRSPSPAREESRLEIDEWREFTRSVWTIANRSDAAHPAIFPTEIPRRLIKLFSLVGETVLDPFAGTGTTAVVAVELGRRSICIDQHPDYVRLMERRLQEPISAGLVQVFRGDCRRLEMLPDNSIDLIVTSPPYWDKANYGDDPANLGRLHNYTLFLREMAACLREMRRVLRPGRRLCLVIANVSRHTNQGLVTFPLPADLTVLARSLGFLPSGEIIWNKDGTGGRWGSWGTQRPIFGSYPYPPNFYFKVVHESIVILRKPPTRRSSTQAPSLAEVMGPIPCLDLGGHDHQYSVDAEP